MNVIGEIAHRTVFCDEHLTTLGLANSICSYVIAITMKAIPDRITCKQGFASIVQTMKGTAYDR